MGYVPTVKDAVRTVGSLPVDLILLHIRYVAELKTPIRNLFRPMGIDVEFLTCFDTWYDSADEDDGGALKAVGKV